MHAMQWHPLGCMQALTHCTPPHHHNAQAYSSLQSEVTVTDSLLGHASPSPSAPSEQQQQQHNLHLGSAGPSGQPPRPPLTSFNQLNGRPYWFSLKLRKNMAEAGYNLPTPIQQHTIPIIHSGGCCRKSSRTCARGPLASPLGPSADVAALCTHDMVCTKPPGASPNHQTATPSAAASPPHPLQPIASCPSTLPLSPPFDAQAATCWLPRTPAVARPPRTWSPCSAL
jgi:hypothetical protein